LGKKSFYCRGKGKASIVRQFWGRGQLKLQKDGGKRVQMEESDKSVP